MDTRNRNRRRACGAASVVTAAAVAIAVWRCGAVPLSEGAGREPGSPIGYIISEAAAGNAGNCLLLNANGDVGVLRAGRKTVEWRDLPLDVDSFGGFLRQGSSFAIVGTSRGARRVLLYSVGNGMMDEGAVDLPPDTRIACSPGQWFAAITRLPPLDPAAPDGPRRPVLSFWHYADGRWANTYDWTEPGDPKIRAVRFVDENTAVLCLARPTEGRDGYGGGRELVLFDAPSKTVIRRARVESMPGVEDLSVSDGGRFITVADPSTVEVFEASSLKLLGRFKPDMFDAPSRASASPDGSRVAYGTDRLEVMNLKTRQVTVVDKLDTDLVRSSLDLSTLGGWVGMGGSHGLSNALLRRYLCLVEVRFTDAGNKLVAVTRSGMVRIWDTKDWHLLLNTNATRPPLLQRLIERGNAALGRQGAG